MDQESLKAIIELINQLGAGSKEAFIWWLLVTHGASYLFGFIWSCIGGVAVYFSYRLTCGAIASFKLASAAGVEPYFSSSELSKACRVLEEHYRKK